MPGNSHARLRILEYQKWGRFRIKEANARRLEIVVFLCAHYEKRRKIEIKLILGN